MSILDEFDPNSNPLFTPEHIYGKREKIADVCIVTFHHRVLEKVLGNTLLRRLPLRPPQTER